MLVSVLMPVYNGGPYLRAAIESVLQQSFADFELDVIDDGSTDGSDRLLAEFAAGDRRVRVHTQENRGLIATLNRGFELARGELVARMDADDRSRPDRLEKQVAYLRAHPSVAVVGGALQYLGQDGPIEHYVRHPLEPEALREKMRRHSALVHPSVMLRRDAVREVGGFRAAYRHAEDYDLWLRIAERHDLANLADVLLEYRVHGSQVSMLYVEQQVVSTIAARLAAGRRGRGETDPTDGLELVTRADVERMGARPDEIERELIASFGFKAREASLLGLGAVALQLADAMDARAWSDGLRGEAAAEADWIRAKAHLGAGDLWRAGVSLWRASRRRPTRLARALLRRVRGGDSASSA